MLPGLTLVLRSACLVFLMWTGNIHAAAIDRSDPVIMLQQATDQLLAISRAARDFGEDEHQRYYDQVAGILDQVIDRNYFTRGVMATYASERLYRTLETEAEKQRFRARIDQFADALQKVLIEKYADALTLFKGEKIELKSLEGSNSPAGKTSVLQTIFDQGNKSYRVQYNLSQQKDGRWLITNVVVEGINLGIIYRNQFAEAVEKNRGDVDYVIEHWDSLMNQPQIKRDSADG